MADLSVTLAATAKRLIDKHGRTVTLLKHGSTPADGNKPWRGVSAPVDATVTGKAAFVPRTFILASFAADFDGVLEESEYALFAADNDDGELLETFNVMQDGSRDWKIMRTELIAPGDTRVLYMMQVKR